MFTYRPTGDTLSFAAKRDRPMTAADDVRRQEKVDRRPEKHRPFALRYRTRTVDSAGHSVGACDMAACHDHPEPVALHSPHHDLSKRFEQCRSVLRGDGVQPTEVCASDLQSRGTLCQAEPRQAFISHHRPVGAVPVQHTHQEASAQEPAGARSRLLGLGHAVHSRPGHSRCCLSLGLLFGSVLCSTWMVEAILRG